MEGLIPLIYRAVLRNRGQQMYRSVSSDSSRGFYTNFPCDSPRLNDNGLFQGEIQLQNAPSGPNQALRRRNVTGFTREESVESNPSK
ncbi:hypothetical protein SUGI_0498920 [Cryptomeria japonica]|nr:hypothetical protein SUGI_0498920 [Cryptomeria japonica]